MLSLALFYLLAVICSARRTHALPIYPEADPEPQADFIQKLAAEVEDGEIPVQGEQREGNNLYPLLNQLYGDRDPWMKGMNKDSAPKESYSNMVDDLKEVVLKLAVADKLRSQDFRRSRQSIPKTNKRACFWKYCVTN
uniref:Urotensin-related peptide 1 n=1 Tax=Gadus morhua TaxID=8049 RepID=A0A8C5CLS4_GADMO